MSLTLVLPHKLPVQVKFFFGDDYIWKLKSRQSFRIDPKCL